MQIVIDISEDNYKLVQNGNYCGILSHEIYNAIKNGTLLPKGHGDLIDRRELKKAEQTYSCDYEQDGFSHVVEIRDIDDAQAIIKAESKEEYNLLGRVVRNEKK